jgi:von Willebrand factor type A domain
MNLDSLFTRLGLAAALTGVIALLAASGGASAAPQGEVAAIKGCTKSNNIEAIIDDSGSMAGSDPAKFRTRFLDVFTSLAANNGKTLGGVEFGTTAAPLFAPAPIPGVRAAMLASFGAVDADNGGTDYDAGISLGNQQNPNQNGRIFLTDGAPTNFNPAILNNPNVRTAAVGTLVTSDTSAQATLNQIANATGGAVFNVDDAAQLQAIAGAVTAMFDCKAVIQKVLQFTRQGQTRQFGFKAPAKAVDMLITLPFDGRIVISQGGGAGASSAIATTAKAKIKQKFGSSFTTVRVKGLKKGKKVKFKAKAKKLPGAATATVQVIG